MRNARLGIVTNTSVGGRFPVPHSEFRPPIDPIPCYTRNPSTICHNAPINIPKVCTAFSIPEKIGTFSLESGSK